MYKNPASAQIKVIYLTFTRPDISFAVSVVDQFMQDPNVPHWQVVL